MFGKFYKTNYPPSQKPILVWDGDCSFCHYWVIRFQKITGSKVSYQTYQHVASQFEDIPLKEFKKASRLIETDGRIYSGPDSAYRALTYSEKKSFWHLWYCNKRWFTLLSDHGYNHIAKNRSTYFKITKLCLGNDPKNFRPYWLVYLFMLAFIFFGIFQIL